MCIALTYYVCTEGTEGMSPTHVEMSRVERLEESDVIKTLSLEKEEKAGKDGEETNINTYCSRELNAKR